MLLYLLLSGQHPVGPGPHSTADLVKAIVDTEPPRTSDAITLSEVKTREEKRGSTPEKLRRQLQGDVDTIVGKALKKDPAERYPSVSALADDLQRYLKNEPISARPDTPAYRAAKFVGRNRTLVLLTTSALIIVIASLSTGQYAANRERKVAEHRFVQVRQLANKFINVDEQLRGLPGATKVRSTMVADSLQYLAALGDEVQIDKDLALEIGLAYVRVAHTQGDPTSPNLGQFTEAEKSLQKAEKFVGTVVAKYPEDKLALGISATIAHDLMTIADTQGRPEEALSKAAIAAGRVDRLTGHPKFGSGNEYGAAYFYVSIAATYANHRHFEETLRYCQRVLAVPLADKYARSIQGDVFFLSALASWQSGDLEGALKTGRQGLELFKEFASSGHATSRANLVKQMLQHGMILGKQDAEPSLERTADALGFLQNAMDMTEELASKDPDDNLSRANVVAVSLELGNILRHSDPKRALAVYDHALARIQEVPSNEGTQRAQTELFAASAYAAQRLGHHEVAKRRIDRAFRLLGDAHQYPANKVEPMSDLDHALRASADGYAEAGQTAKALEAYQQLLAKLMAWKTDPQNDLRDATCISRTWTALAELQRRSGRPDEAAQFEAQRAVLWNHWKSKLPNAEFLFRQSLRQAFDPPASKHL